MLPHLHLHPALPAAGSPSTRRGTRARGGGGGGERMPSGGSPAVIFLPPATAGREAGPADRKEEMLHAAFGSSRHLPRL